MRTLVIVSMLALTGCATLSQDECRRADWQAQGSADALKGYPLSRVEEHREACFKYGVQPDFNAYQAGHEAGLSGYCTFEGGYRAGYGGYSYYKLCPADTEARFLEGYNTGREVYQEKLHYELLYDSRFHRRYHWHRHHW